MPYGRSVREDEKMSVSDFLSAIKNASSVPVNKGVAPAAPLKEKKSPFKDPEFLTGVIKGMTGVIGDIARISGENNLAPRETTLPWGVTPQQGQEYHQRMQRERALAAQQKAEQDKLTLEQQKMQAEDERAKAQQKLSERAIGLQEQKLAQDQTQFEQSLVGQYILNQQSKQQALDLEALRNLHEIDRMRDEQRFKQEVEIPASKANAELQAGASKYSADKQLEAAKIRGDETITPKEKEILANNQIKNIFEGIDSSIPVPTDVQQQIDPTATLKAQNARQAEKARALDQAALHGTLTWNAYVAGHSANRTTPTLKQTSVGSFYDPTATTTSVPSGARTMFGAEITAEAPPVSKEEPIIPTSSTPSASMPQRSPSNSKAKAFMDAMSSLDDEENPSVLLDVLNAFLGYRKR